jgi:hypothetical protein
MSHFDEPQTPEPIFVDCPDCKGETEELSICCGAMIDSDMLICYECKEHSDIAVCETCDGTGSIEIDREDLREDAADRKHDENNNN